ncbi:MAG: hypothetical protein QOH25_350 [Acidobacteriota bacterium]|nr:hypothetical protein [Acidobacteriota bacterium]
MRSLQSFFNLYNHPFSEASQANLIAHDWANELRIVRGTLLRCSQLVFQSVHFEKSDNTIFDETDAPVALAHQEVKTGVKDSSLLALATALGDAHASCQSLLNLRPVSLHAWVNLGQRLDGELDKLEGTKILAGAYSRQGWMNIPAPLLDLTREVIKPVALGTDVLFIFSSLFRLLEYLRFVETFLRQDQSLKQTLPIFTLVHEETRLLTEFIETRALQIEGLEKSIFDALDSMNYAIKMELRKVFAYELVGLSSLQQAPVIYVKVENSHGLLRDSFQQSVVGLTQLFNPALDGTQLFDAFRTKLEQSLALRRDLWTLLQLVRRCENEPDADAIDNLLKSLAWFREGSLRYLMFKDWEASERFMEEVDAARGHVEIAAVLHRYAAYLEALSSQVSMRAVLVNHPFDYPEPEGLS